MFEKTICRVGERIDCPDALTGGCPAGRCKRTAVRIEGMALSIAERQKAFKQAMAEAGFVRLEAWVTREQREKFRQIGGDDWLRKKIDAAKPKERG